MNIWVKEFVVKNIRKVGVIFETALFEFAEILFKPFPGHGPP